MPSPTRCVILGIVVGSTFAGGTLFLPWLDSGGGGIIDYPLQINLGPQEFGETVTRTFHISNRGAHELEVMDFSTSCSCAGVEALTETGYRQVKSRQIPAGQETEFRVRIAVGGRPGMSQTVQVGFRTSDPKVPNGYISVLIPTITGKVCALPTAVVFGDVEVGTSLRQVVRLYDNRNTARRVSGVRSLNPDRFRVQLVIPKEGEAEPQHETAGRHIASIEIVPLTDRPGRLDGKVEVQVVGEERRPDEIDVIGCVVGNLRICPEVLVLPQRHNGNLQYEGQVVIETRRPRSFSVSVEKSATGLSGTISTVAEESGHVIVTIRAVPSEFPEDRSTQSTIRLRIKDDTGLTSSIDIPVLVLRDAK